MKKFNNLSPRQSLNTIYKSFIRPHLDNGDMTSLAMIHLAKTWKACNIMLALL